MLGSDVSETAVNRARAGLYTQFEAQRGLAVTQMIRWFEELGGGDLHARKSGVVVNVMATLRGTQAESRERLYVVSGHYDSMPSSPVDPERDAPGANDDASGVAAVMDPPRVRSVFRAAGTPDGMWTLDSVAAALGPVFGDRAPSVGFLCEDTLELATETIGFGKRA